jgi:peptidoglycan/LPS O-acetylase OafA/YrhL
VAVGHHHIAFAHRLRGVAALFVMLHHYLSFLYAPPLGVMAAINMPAVDSKGYTDLFIQLMNLQLALEPYALDIRNWGLFGVGLFFLVSGFVIPAALLRVRVPGFLAARFLRLWPTYAMSLLSIVGMLALASYVAGNPLPFKPPRLATNLLLVEDLIFGSTMDLVSWTLTIEVMFYLLCAAIVPLLRLTHTPRLTMIAVLLGMVGYTFSQLTQLQEGAFLPTLARDLRFLPYLFIGTLFHFHFRGLLTTGSLILNAVILLVLHVGSSCLVNIAGAAQQGYYLVYVYAFLVFGLTYAIYNKVKFLPTVVAHALDRLATISYPLYLVHAVHGYVVINILLFWHVSVYLALMCAVLWSFVVAIALHRWVERPTHAMARRMSARYPVPARLVRRPPPPDIRREDAAIP